MLSVRRPSSKICRNKLATCDRAPATLVYPDEISGPLVESACVPPSYLAMRLFKLVQQNNAVRLAADSLGERATLVIAWWRGEEAPLRGCAGHAPAMVAISRGARHRTDCSRALARLTGPANAPT